jgi:hypothetical protein
MDGVDDRGAVGAPQVDRGDPEVRVPQSAPYDDQRDALTAISMGAHAEADVARSGGARLPARRRGAAPAARRPLTRRDNGAGRSTLVKIVSGIRAAWSTAPTTC